MMNVPKYRWGEEVKKLYGYRCAFCGSTEKIEAHHINQVALFPDLETSLENGIALCHNCHYAAHNGDYTTKYRRSEMVVVPVLMPKQRKDDIKALADAAGKNVNKFINDAIEREKNESMYIYRIPDDLLEFVKKTVEKYGGSVSEFIHDAIVSYAKVYPSIMKLKSMETELYAAQEEARKRVGVEEPDEPEKQEDSFSNLSTDEIIEKFQQVGRIRSITSQNDDLQKE